MNDKTLDSLSINELARKEDRTPGFTPSTFRDFIGQQDLKNKLSLYAKAAKMRDEALDHLLISGPPGLGKTTIAKILAREMGVNIKICSGPMVERTGDLVALLSSLETHDVMFIDEIHRLPIAVEEVLYSAMEEFRIDVVIGQGMGAQSISLPLAPFTLIGATTRGGIISAPLRSRFGITERIDFYNEDDLAKIVLQTATHAKIKITHDATERIATSARGTPRIAKKLTLRVRDFAQVGEYNQITQEIAFEAMKMLGIDEQGLSKLDNDILRIIAVNYNGGPVGVETIAAITGEDSDTLESVYEPFLIRRGLLEKTPRGRQIPPKTLPFLKRKFTGQTTIA